MQDGEKCMILPSVSKEDADKLFPGYTVKDVPSGKKYIRLADQPKWLEQTRNEQM